VTVLSPRAKRLVRAAKALHGRGWQSRMSRTIDGCSQTLISLIASGEKEVSDKLENALLQTLKRERKRLNTLSGVLDEIIEEIKQEKHNA
jgi:hypothetical protein